MIDYLDRHELSGLAVTDNDRVLATDDLAELRAEPASASMREPHDEPSRSGGISPERPASSPG